LTQRPRAEGTGELAMGFTAGAATALAGPVMGLAVFATLAVAAAFAAAALVPVIAGLSRRRVPVAAS
jgi:hypothetical protein